MAPVLRPLITLAGTSAGVSEEGHPKDTADAEEYIMNGSNYYQR